MRRAFPIVPLALALAACEPAPLPPSQPALPRVDAAAMKFDAVPRLDVNRIAAELNLPLFWIADTNSNRSLDPDEVTVLFRHDRMGPVPVYVHEGRFTPEFFAAYAAVAKVKAEGHRKEGLSEAETKRRTVVLAELAGGQPTLIHTRLRDASTEDRALVEHVVKAAAIIDRLYEKQLGTAGLDAGIPADDVASHMLFYRNHGPFCQAPRTENDPACSALARRPPRLSGLYPASVQKDPKFCEKLEARPDHAALLNPFVVVAEKGGELTAVPYSVAYQDDMRAVSRELAAAADAIQSPGEAALKAYLVAASKAFLDNLWTPADEAWAKMGVHNSHWFLRVAPDEVYADPCSRKAGFQVSFARINQDSLVWQKKLDPLKSDMEAEVAKLAGAPYKARSVSFRIPDFIDVVLNAGDARAPLGGTAGQSLPNWGPVANEGRGRTVAMINLNTDPDSLSALRDKAESTLCRGSLDPAVLDPTHALMGTVLHEAAHNLGPAHEYKVDGKADGEIFGGPLASTFEELKAQTSAMYLANWLADRGVVTPTQATLAHERDILWAFGHISEGMYGGDGSVKHYSQLAAIQVGSFLDAGALAFHPDEMAVNGRDKGCFAIARDKLPGAIAALETKVLAIKGAGDKAGALKLREAYVDNGGEWKRLRGVIEERWLRYPRASFVYAIER